MTTLRQLAARPALMAWRTARAVMPIQPGFRVILLHHVPNEQHTSLARLIDVLQHRHVFLTPEQAAQQINGATSVLGSAAPLLLTFDDGFASNYDVARTILDPAGLKAVFFVCPGLIDMPRDIQRGAIAAQIFDGCRSAADLPHDLTLMDWNQIAELKAAGHVIGSHGAMHRKLSRLPAEAQTLEIADANRRLTEILGGKTDWYAYAFGDIASIDRMALQTIARHHRFCRSGIRGINSSTTSPFALRGDELDLSAPLAYQQLIAEGGLAPLYTKAALHLDALAT